MCKCRTGGWSMRDLQTISLRELLPPSIAADPSILAAADAIDAELRAATERVPGVSIIPNVRSITNSALIDLLAWQFHVDFYDAGAPLAVRRALVAKSLDWHFRKGTPAVVEEVVTAALSDAVITEWFEYGGKPYFFRIATEMPLSSEDEIRTLLDAIFSVKNTRSWLEFIQALTTAWVRLYFGAGVYERETVSISLRSPFISPFLDGAPVTYAFYGFARGVYRGRITTYAEYLDISMISTGVYGVLDGTITTRAERVE